MDSLSRCLTPLILFSVALHLSSESNLVTQLSEPVVVASCKFLKFLTKLHHSENAICKLFEKYIIDEFDIVHGHLFS